MSVLGDDWQKMEGVEGRDPKGIEFKVFYSGTTHKFRVDVAHGETKLSDEFGACHRPIFGMDVDDHRQAMEIAEKLAVKIEQDLGL